MISTKRIGNKYVGATFNVYGLTYQLTPIEWTLELEDGYFTTSFTLFNLQVVLEFLVNAKQAETFYNKLEKAKEEMDKGDYYFFVHARNKELKDFGEFMEEKEGLRFWQGLYAWTGAKTIAVDGEDPFYWEETKRKTPTQIVPEQDGSLNY